MNELRLIILIPLLFASIIPFVSEHRRRQIRLFGRYRRWLRRVDLYLKFDKNDSGYQFMSIISNDISLGVDGISILLIVLTSMLTPICILIGWHSVTKRIKEYLIFLLRMESMIIIVFSVIDIWLFYIFFESVLIPMYLIIGIWGAREEKKMAAYQFFMYTLIGSLLMLLAIVWIYVYRGTTNLLILREYRKNVSRGGIDIDMSVYQEEQKWLWLRFFASFATKVPMIPVHLWLPQAHVEAPTAGSVILAGILLKLGTYGMIRLSLTLFPEGSIYFTPLVQAMSVIGIIYASLTTIRQIDLKRIIAYSSVAHMNFVTLGVFACDPIYGESRCIGVEGATMLMISHGLISSALFIRIGVVYDRYHTRLLPYYGGLTTIMPIYSVLFIFFTFANISFPGTASFVGELLILLGVFKENRLIRCVARIGVVLGAVYSIWLRNRILYGETSKYIVIKNNYIDCTRKELAIILPLRMGTLIMGINPNILIERIHASNYYWFI
jgi:NADH-quinone oxidoreductase subunit M